MKNECSIVRDILPLYAEKMVSKDTAEFVKGHLENCPVCCAELEKLREPVEVQAEPQTDIDAAPLKRLKKALLIKKVQTILCTAAVLLALVLSVISFLTAPKYFAYSPELVTVTKTEGGHIVLSFDERITNYTLQRIITGKDIKEVVYYLEVWTTTWDRLTGRHGIQNALVRETTGLPVYIFFQQNYALNNVDMDSVCIYGNLSRLNGSWVSLPGLSLGYWLLFNIALFLILGCVLFRAAMISSGLWQGAYPPLHRAGNSDSRCLRAGASVRAGLSHRILFAMARFSAYICHRGAILLRHAACIEHPLQKEGNKRC